MKSRQSLMLAGFIVASGLGCSSCSTSATPPNLWAIQSRLDVWRAAAGDNGALVILPVSGEVLEQPDSWLPGWRFALILSQESWILFFDADGALLGAVPRGLFRPPHHAESVTLAQVLRAHSGLADSIQTAGILFDEYPSRLDLAQLPVKRVEINGVTYYANLFGWVVDEDRGG